jgi:hypothetical protein
MYVMKSRTNKVVDDLAIINADDSKGTKVNEPALPAAARWHLPGLFRP